jgi:hypothetical protein
MLSWHSDDSRLPFKWEVHTVWRNGVRRLEMRAKGFDFAKAMARAEFGAAKGKRRRV